MKLSILIPTLFGREPYLNRLLGILKPQLTDDVELVIEIDNGTMSIGEKRNVLIEKAKGDYTCFVDDDDRVSDNYVSEIMVGVNKQVDVVSIKGELTTNGAQPHRFVDRPYSKWTRLNDGTYIRGVQHLDAIKRSITSQFKFPHKNFGEDQEWDNLIETSQLVRSYHQVESLVYFYDYRTEKRLSYSIIIPSANAENLIACVNGIIENEPGLLVNKIIVVDDGARSWSEGSLPYGIKWVEGKKPFNYARNINLGIQEAVQDDDIILLNDDAVLRTPGGFSALVKSAKNHGVMSAVTNYVGNPEQIYTGASGIRYEGRTLAFVCVCIPRTTLDKVGILDERFTSYGGEDNDYCLRVRLAGLRLAIFDGCFVDHRSLQNTFNRDMLGGEAIYIDKWGAGYDGIPKIGTV